MKKFKISTEYITLGQFLKLADCIDTGGQAKPSWQRERIRERQSRKTKEGKNFIKMI